MNDSLTSQDDYEIKFSLSELEERGPRQGYDADPLVRMVQLFLGDLLELGYLTWRGEKVNADGFVLTAIPDRIYEIAPSPPGGEGQASETDDELGGPLSTSIL